MLMQHIQEYMHTPTELLNAGTLMKGLLNIYLCLGFLYPVPWYSCCVHSNTYLYPPQSLLIISKNYSGFTKHILYSVDATVFVSVTKRNLRLIYCI